MSNAPINATESILRSIQERLGNIEAILKDIAKAQDRFCVRQAIVETRQNDLTGDLAAIARVIERAGLVD